MGLELELGLEMEMATGSGLSFGWMLLEGTVQPMAPENNKVPEHISLHFCRLDSWQYPIPSKCGGNRRWVTPAHRVRPLQWFERDSEL